MNRHHPVSQSEVSARIGAMTFSERRQLWADWDCKRPGYPFKAWAHQRVERLLHEEAAKSWEDRHFFHTGDY